jgi:hypothetical protein
VQLLRGKRGEIIRAAQESQSRKWNDCALEKVSPKLAILCGRIVDEPVRDYGGSQAMRWRAAA